MILAKLKTYFNRTNFGDGRECRRLIERKTRSNLMRSCLWRTIMKQQFEEKLNKRTSCKALRFFTLRSRRL